MRCIVINPSVCGYVCLRICQCVCLSASISLEPLDRSSRNFMCGSPVAVVRSFSVCCCATLCTSGFMDDVTFGRNGRDAETRRLHRAATAMSGVAIPVRSLMSMNACLDSLLNLVWIKMYNYTFRSDWAPIATVSNSLVASRSRPASVVLSAPELLNWWYPVTVHTQTHPHRRHNHVITMRWGYIFNRVWLCACLSCSGSNLSVVIMWNFEIISK